VVIAKLVSTTWVKRVCGEEIPYSRYKYKLDVLDDVFSDVSGELEILGLTNDEFCLRPQRLAILFYCPTEKSAKLNTLFNG